MDYDPNIGGGGTQGLVSSGTVASSVTPRTPSIRTTQPEELIRHNISDEELEMLKDTNRDGLNELFWGCVGAALASLPPACESLLKAYHETPAVPITIAHQAEIIIFVVTTAVAIVLLVISRSRSRRATDLVEGIRRRRAFR